MGAEDNLGTTQRRASVKWIGSINATILINMYPSQFSKHTYGNLHDFI